MTIRSGDFSFDFGEEEHTFTNITYHNPIGGPPQVLNAAAMGQLLASELTVARLQALDFPCKEAARAISVWLNIQDNNYQRECAVAKMRGEPVPQQPTMWKGKKRK